VRGLFNISVGKKHTKDEKRTWGQIGGWAYSTEGVQNHVVLTQVGVLSWVRMNTISVGKEKKRPSRILVLGGKGKRGNRRNFRPCKALGLGGKNGTL